MIKRLQRSQYYEWLVLVLVAFFVATLLNFYSPINSNYSGDFDIFMLFAQSWAMGDIPFVEVFDHKGPFQFVIYLLGVLIAPNKWGVYIINIIWLIAIFKLMISTIKLFIRRDGKTEYILFLVAFSFMLFTGVSLTCEVASLPFTLLPLYLTARYWSSEQPLDKHSLLYSFTYGICLAIVFLIRPNNGVVNCGLIIGFIIQLLAHRNLKTLLIQGLSLLGGFLAVVTPTLLYFYYIDALDAMIESAYLFNFAYLGDGAGANVQENLVKMLPAVYLIILSILYDRKFNVKYALYLIPSSVLMILLHMGCRGYGHYFTSMFPIFLMSVILSYKICNDNTSRLLICSFLLFSSLNIGSLAKLVTNTMQNIKIIYSSSYRQQLNSDDRELDRFLEFIPRDEWGQIYSYQLFFNLSSFIRHRINPVGKFFHFNETYSLYPPYKEYLDDFHNTTTVKWIVTSVSQEGSNLDSFKNLLHNYELVFSQLDGSPQTRIYLYRRIK